MPELEANHDASEAADRRRARQLLHGGYFLVFALLFCFCATLVTRGQIRRSRAEALLRFEASIQAQYGEYEYQPPPMGRGSYPGGQLTLVFGRGQRVLDFGVIDDPPRYIAWIPAIFGDYSLTHVTDIAIFDERFSDADVDLLLPFADLRALDLSGTAVTDMGLAKLSSLNRLELLNLCCTQVTNASLPILANFTQLKELELPECADDEAIAFLQQKLPNCWIYR
ncbi:MAG TPA: hypothetical protein VMV10_14265 [Pirellulales bacterium]|nr:hypothetical protein [Pirellulales bacterium]